jgi:hypothetical protein
MEGCVYQPHFNGKRRYSLAAGRIIFPVRREGSMKKVKRVKTRRDEEFGREGSCTAAAHARRKSESTPSVPCTSQSTVFWYAWEGSSLQRWALVNNQATLFLPPEAMWCPICIVLLESLWLTTRSGRPIFLPSQQKPWRPPLVHSRGGPRSANGSGQAVPLTGQQGRVHRHLRVQLLVLAPQL